MNDQSIVKPHYRLLGMLLERQELRSTLSDYRQRHSERPLKNDPMVVELERQIIELDAEILVHQRQVRQHFLAEGRSLGDLRAFIGDDLLDELRSVSAASKRAPAMGSNL